MYTLFQGDNISVGQGKDLYPVHDVNGGSWVIVVNGKEVLVSANLGRINMKVTPLLKLTEVSATLSDLTTERSYTYMNDPAVRLTRSLSQTAVENAGYQSAVNQATAVSNRAIAASEMGINRGSGGGTAPAGSTTLATAATVQAQQNLNAASNSAGSDLFANQAKDNTGEFDALDVSFNISSASHLDVPYVVTMTRFHESGEPEGSFKNLIFAKAIDPVDSKAMKIHFQQAGFPLGYILENFEIHVYDRGREVATNIAARRQELTSDQAFDYVRTKYVDAHKGDTLPALPVMGDLPGDLAAHVATGHYDAPFYVRVSKDGLPQEVFSDPACTTKMADGYLESVVGRIRFKPALARGEPVEGVATLNLSQLRL